MLLIVPCFVFVCVQCIPDDKKDVSFPLYRKHYQWLQSLQNYYHHKVYIFVNLF